MSSAIEAGEPLAFDLADRLRKALRVSGVGVAEMAKFLGVSRNTVGNWINGHVPPSLQTRRLWAMRTGVPFEWLETGATPRASPPSDLNGRPTAGQTARNRRSVANGRADRRLMVAA